MVQDFALLVWRSLLVYVSNAHTRVTLLLYSHDGTA